MGYRRGKTPARPGAVSFQFDRYVMKAALPTPPAIFGYQKLQRGHWEIFGNDDYCDCVWAGAAHETMLWKRMAHRKATFSRISVLTDYAKATGFNPYLPKTDNGTDMQRGASWRRKTGIVDAKGKKHKILAYLALRPGDFDQLVLAIYLFGAVGIGLRLPDTADRQFDRKKPWSVVEGSRVTGGHYVPGFGRDKDGNIIVVSWGRSQRMTPQFYKRYSDEAIAYISVDALLHGKSRGGLRRKQLIADLKALRRPRSPFPV
ncbi:MAG TPA: hypothetical protein VFI23_04265 [Rhizomicrobium sp.]|nr:hypothetical protein [Rhizomicrobium sp.]